MTDKDLNSRKDETKDIFKTFIDMKLSSGEFDNDSFNEDDEDSKDDAFDEYDEYDDY